MPMPPVSVSSTKRSSRRVRAETRSRVVPAVGSTMAMRLPLSQLNSDDLPTLGRPTMATTGTATARPSSWPRYDGHTPQGEAGQSPHYSDPETSIVALDGVALLECGD